MARSGILRLTLDPNSNQFVSQNLTDNKIQTLYNEIPSLNKALSKGIYVPSDNTVRWMYRSVNTSISGNYYGFDKALFFDDVLNAWYTNTLIPSASLQHGLTNPYGLC